MPRDGAATRGRILDAAHRLVLRQGFAATTVDAVIEEAGITKGAFFHHFRSKAELARAVVERYADEDAGHLEEFMRRAEEAAADPLEQLVRFVELFAEAAPTLAGEEPGCLYASFVYERQLFDAGARDVVAESVRRWRTALVAKLEEVAAVHPPRLPVDLEALADQMLTVFEGGYVLSRALDDPAIVTTQLVQFRVHLEALFGPARTTAGAAHRPS